MPQCILLKKYGKPESAFELRDFELHSLKEDEVHIEVEASGINFAEVLGRKKLYPEAPKLPYVPGYEVVGRIKAVGEKVKDLQLNQRVAAYVRFGGYSSEVIAKEASIYPIPEEVDVGVVLALITQGSTAWHASEELVNIHPGDHILVQAASGGVGNLIVQLAKRKGAVVFGTASSKAKLDYLGSIGVDYPIDYQKSDFYKEVKKVLDANKRLDFVFDSIGGEVFNKGLKLIGANGAIITFGLADAVTQNVSLIALPKLLFQTKSIHPLKLLAKSQSVIGINLLKLMDFKQSLIMSHFSNILDLVLENEIIPKIDKSFMAEDISKAHEYLESRKSIGKNYIKWRESK